MLLRSTRSLTVDLTLFKQHPARDLQDTFYVSDPVKAGRPAPTSADDKHDYEAYFQNVRDVHESGKYGSIGYRYPWSEDESLRCVTFLNAWSLQLTLDQARPANTHDFCLGRHAAEAGWSAERWAGTSSSILLYRQSLQVTTASKDFDGFGSRH